MPTLPMIGVRREIGARLEKPIIKLQVEVVSLEVGGRDYAWHRSRKLAEGVENVLCLQSHTFPELFAMHLGGRSHGRRVFPRTGSVDVERSAAAKFALAQSINSRPHVCKVRGTKSSITREPGGIWVGPSFVGVETKSDSRHLGRATGAENAEGIDPIEHPSPQSHGLKKQRSA